MISHSSFVLLVPLLFIVLYGITYIPARKAMNRKSTKGTLLFLANFVFVLYLGYFYQKSFMKKIGIEARITDWSTRTMTAGIAMHHLAILFEQRRSTSRTIRLMHNQISHVLISVPMSINSVTASAVMAQNPSGMLGFTIILAFSFTFLSYSTIVLLAGIKKIKLPW